MLIVSDHLTTVRFAIRNAIVQTCEKTGLHNASNEAIEALTDAIVHELFSEEAGMRWASKAMAEDGS